MGTGAAGSKVTNTRHVQRRIALRTVIVKVLGR